MFLTYLDEPTAYAPKSYDPFTVLFRNTYGFTAEYNGTSSAGKMFPREPALPDRLVRETQPNSARFYCLPILPDPDAKPLQPMSILKLNAMRNDAAVKSAFDPLYPDDGYNNAAFALEVDDSFFVLNGNENRDADQFFKLKLDPAGIQFMQGDLPFQNLIFGKREGPGNFWFQTNGYHGDGKTAGQRYKCDAKPTSITFTCEKRPEIGVEDGKDAAMKITKAWDAESKSISLSFDHTEGAVNFRIRIVP